MRFGQTAQLKVNKLSTKQLLAFALPLLKVIFYYFAVNKYAKVERNPKSRVYLWGQACYGALGNPGKQSLRLATQTFLFQFCWNIMSLCNSVPNEANAFKSS
jgi:hypothetical protein